MLQEEPDTVPEEAVSYTALQDNEPAVTPHANNLDTTKSFGSRMHDTAVYAGGKVGYYVVGPAVAYYALYPVAQAASEPVVVAAGAAIAALPISWPAIGVMTFAVSMAIPKIVNYPVAAVQNKGQAIGESATTKLLTGSKTAITYTYTTSANAVSSLWLKPERPVDYLPCDEEFEFLEIEPLKEPLNPKP